MKRTLVIFTLFIFFNTSHFALSEHDDIVHYNDYKVYTFKVQNHDQLEVVAKLHDDNSLDFWSQPRLLNRDTTVMVPLASQHDFERLLTQHNIAYEILINNVEDSIVQETTRQLLSPRSLRGSATFTKYMTHSEINDYLDTLAEQYPDVVTVRELGRSYENRRLKLIEITGNRSEIRPTVFADAGIHAREWIAPALALYIINQLVENPDNADLLQKVNWAILPVANPDGYEYTRTTNRLWRKTRSRGVSCYGADPNRNFDYYWMETGASDNECSDIYAGRLPFSESETRLMRDYLLDNRDSLVLYLAIHSYGQYILYPWGYTSDLPNDADELHSLGDRVNAAIAAVNGTTYTVGSSTNVLYAAAGCSDDYAKGAAGIELSYTLELPGGGNYGFNPPASSILGIVQETFEGIKAYIQYIEEKYA